jgi:hypothetical protein
MTTTTFLVGVSLGILSFKWNPPVRPQIAFIALSGIVWMLALLLFLVFTRLTYQEMESAREKRRQLLDGSKSGRGDQDKSFHPRQDVASHVLALLTFFYGMLLMYLSGIRLWPPDTGLASASLLKAAAYAAPACTALAGLAAELFTICQPSVSRK